MNGKNHSSSNPLMVVGSSVDSGFLEFFLQNHRFWFFQKKN
jgi:hypothetical protein